MSNMTEDREHKDPLDLGTTTGIPLMSEISLTVVKLIVTVVAVLTAIFSIMAKATLLDVLFRTCVAIIVFGVLGWLFNWFLGKFLVEAKLAEMIEEKEKESEFKSQGENMEKEEVENTREFNA